MCIFAVLSKLSYQQCDSIGPCIFYHNHKVLTAAHLGWQAFHTQTTVHFVNPITSFALNSETKGILEKVQMKTTEMLLKTD